MEDSGQIFKDVNEKNVGELLEQLRQKLKVSIEDEAFAKELDSRDPLKTFRDKFYIPKAPDGGDSIYFCGNSLGLQPKTTRKYIEEELTEWQEKGVEAHFNHSKGRPWVTTDEHVLDTLAELVGAQKEEVAAMNSLSVNIHLMMVPFYRPTATRNKILIEAKAFPSDLYIVQSQIEFHGYDVEKSLIRLPAAKGDIYDTEEIVSFINQHGDSIAMILLPGVQYYTGQLFDIETITRAAHAKGCKIGWDLAHAVGNIPLQLHQWDVDFACWCTYKYLNSGPGNIGGCFVHLKHSNDSQHSSDKVEERVPRFAAWWGHDLSTRFAMNELQFHPIRGAFGYRLSNPPVLCVAALLASLEIFREANIQQLRRKSVLLTTYLEQLLQSQLADKVDIITPRDPAQRGCQLSLVFQVDVTEIANTLQSKGITCDVRKPHVLRVSPTPLYNSFIDVYRFINILKTLL